MTNKDRALQIVNKLFEIAEKDGSVTFSGHCGEMVIGWHEGKEPRHHHIHDFDKFPEQLKQINQTLDIIRDKS